MSVMLCVEVARPPGSFDGDFLAVEQLKAKGSGLEFVDNPALNTGTPQGAFVLAVLAAIAQFGRKTIANRVMRRHSLCLECAVAEELLSQSHSS